MFERFTDQARRAVVEAQAEARSLHHDWLGTEHLLLGLLRDPDDLPAQVLARHEVDLGNARGKVQEIIGERQATPPEAIPFTPRAKTVLHISLREAQELRTDHIGTGHLLLALIHEREGVAPQVLTRLGVDLDEVEHDLLQLLPGEHHHTARTLRQRVQSPGPSTLDLPSAGLAARLDSIDEKLTIIADHLTAIEDRLTGR